MNAYINIWGQKFMVKNIWWNSTDRTIGSVAFNDELGELHTVFNDRHAIFMPDDILYQDRSEDLIHAKLGNIVTFEVV